MHYVFQIAKFFIISAHHIAASSAAAAAAAINYFIFFYFVNRTAPGSSSNKTPKYRCAEKYYSRCRARTSAGGKYASKQKRDPRTPGRWGGVVAVQAAGRLLAPGGRAVFAEADPPPGDQLRAAAAAAAAQARGPGPACLTGCV